MGGCDKSNCSKKLIGRIIGRAGRVVTADGCVEQFLILPGLETACDAVKCAAGGSLKGGDAGLGRLTLLTARHAAVQRGRESPRPHEVQGQDGDDKYVESFSNHIFLVMSVFVF